MMASTHKLIANNIYSNFDIEKQKIVKQKSYIWGNVKPDYISKYKFKNHYFDESIDMTIELINKLSSLSINKIDRDIGFGKFSALLGVVTHFICDYYCLAHYERLRFKNAMKRHISYERELSKISRDYNFVNNSYLEVKIVDEYSLREFINKTLELYSKDPGMSSDLSFSYYVSNTVVNFILDNVIENSNKE